MPRKLQNLLSFLLIAAGAFLLVWGAREIIGSRTGQIEPGREFERSLGSPGRSPKPFTATPGGAPPEPGETVAKLVIPRLDAELYVVEGDHSADLRRGPGHIADCNIGCQACHVQARLPGSRS